MVCKTNKERFKVNLILHPDVAFVFLALSLLVTIFALLAPGSGVLEVLSLILLFIVGYLVANLPVNSWAIILVLIGIVSVILMLRRKRQGYFIAGSIFVLILGMIFVFRGETTLLGVSPMLAGIGAVGMAAFIWIIGRNISAVAHQEPYSDPDRLVGMIGSATTDISREGSVYVNGENWSAVSDKLIKAGSQVKVIQRNGLVLQVEMAQKIQEKIK